jgi:hypothetical protein
MQLGVVVGEQVIEGSGVSEHQLAQFRRQREDHVMVFDRQQVPRLLIEPASAGQRLALGTVVAPARVVRDALVAAIEAVLDMATQPGRATGGQIAPCAARPTAARRSATEPLPYCLITSATSRAGRPVAGELVAGPPACCRGTGASRGPISAGERRRRVWCDGLRPRRGG